MEKFLKVIGVVALMIAFGAPGAMAEGGGEPPPKELDCSPGYWKNHTEVWWGLACDEYDIQSGEEGPRCDDLLAALNARGPGSGAIRDGAASYLNSWAYYNKKAACSDD